MDSAIWRISPGISPGTSETHLTRSPRVIADASARLIPRSSVERARALSLVPPHSSHGLTVRYLSTLWIPFSEFAFDSASSTALTALR